MVDRVERFISPLRKAWVSPDGEVHEFEFGHHEQWLHKNRDEFPKDVLGIARGMSIHAAEKAGWVRLTRRGEAMDVEGTADAIEQNKVSALMWAGPAVRWVNVDVSGRRAFEASPEEFEERSVAYMTRTAEQTGLTIFRRRPAVQQRSIRVRAHRRRRTR